MPGKIKLHFEVIVHAPVAQVYRAFTNRVGVEEWLCDSALVSPRPGGTLFLGWNNGFFSSGQMVDLKPDELVTFTWRGPQDPAQTLVTVKLEDQGNRTSLQLIHSGIWEAKKWANTEAEIKKGWLTGLRNLSSVLECGPDLRITTRPLLGIYLGDPDPELLVKTGVPVHSGVRIEGVVDGLGAQKCGLQKDDVLVAIEDIPIHSLEDFSKVMPGRKAGEVLKVEFYRGIDRKTVAMELTARKTHMLPDDAAALVAEIKAQYSATDQDLFPILASLTDEVASRSPCNGEWSVKSILAHLIQVERDTQSIIHKAIASDHYEYSNNSPARIQATLQAYPHLSDLVIEFKHVETETLAFLAALPPDFIARKGSFWALSNWIIDHNSHTREHIHQVFSVIEALRSNT